MYKKVWCTCEVVVLLIKPIVFFTFSLSSASLDLKVPEPKQRTFLRSGTSGRFKQWMVFGITRVTGVLSVFTFAVWNVLTYSISNFRKIFFAERDSYIFFAPFSYEHFIFHNFIRQAWNAIVYSVFDCQSRHKSSEQKLPYMIAVHFNCSFINHQWDLVYSSLSK